MSVAARIHSLRDEDVENFIPRRDWPMLPPWSKTVNLHRTHLTRVSNSGPIVSKGFLKMGCTRKIELKHSLISSVLTQPYKVSEGLGYLFMEAGE